jgi:HEAT repeat protein
MPVPKKLPFKQLIDALLDENTPFPPRYLHRLSDLEPTEVALLEKAWPKLSVRRRQALMQDLEQLNEADYLLFFEEIDRLALKDSDPEVRLLAIRMLSEYENISLLPTFLDMAEHDADPEVRASSATALGLFVYQGEVDAIPLASLRQVEECLLRLTDGSDEPLVRRSALESLGYSSRKELIPLIERAYASGDTDWVASALFAMGRSADARWESSVQAMLDHKRPAVRAEAATAAGGLEIEDAVPRLIELLDDSDENVRMSSIWSLSQIGGEGVREALIHMLETTEDDDEAELLEEALENLAFTEGVEGFTLIDYTRAASEDNEDDEDPFFFEDEDLHDFDDEGGDDIEAGDLVDAGDFVDDEDFEV